jgi:vacuolar-type H+-ATPase subunit F/Vma7
MNTVAFVTLEDAAPGFALAGVVHLVATADRLEDLLRRLTMETAYGLIGIDERLLTPATEEFISRCQESWEGVFIIMPPPPLVAHRGINYAERLLQKAIGYQVRLNP